MQSSRNNEGEGIRLIEFVLFGANLMMGERSYAHRGLKERDTKSEGTRDFRANASAFVF